MKSEYKENATNSLLLEASYKNHVTNTLAIVVQENREQESSWWSTKQDEDTLEDIAKEYESLLNLHVEWDDSENTYVEDDEAMESKF